MDDVNVTAVGNGDFRVEVDAGGGGTTHRVTVPPGFLDDVGLAGADPEAVVGESFAFLLEREPPTSILGRFALPDISRYFPDYPAEIRRRLGG